MRHDKLLDRLADELRARGVAFRRTGDRIQGGSVDLAAVWQAFGAVAILPAYEPHTRHEEQRMVVRERDGDRLLFESSVTSPEPSSGGARKASLFLSRFLRFEAEDEEYAGTWQLIVEVRALVEDEEFDPTAAVWGAGGPPDSAPTSASEPSAPWGVPNATDWIAGVEATPGFHRILQTPAVELLADGWDV